MFLIWMAYRYGEKTLNWIRTKRQKTINKYKRRWLTRYNPQAIIYQTAIDASYFYPARLTEDAQEKLGRAFNKVDSQLKNGFSRQLLINILARVRKSLIDMRSVDGRNE